MLIKLFLLTESLSILKMIGCRKSHGCMREYSHWVNLMYFERETKNCQLLCKPLWAGIVSLVSACHVAKCLQ